MANAPQPMATNIHVKVFSPYKVYFDDQAESISAENDTGPFDILPRHHNFITLINPCELSVRVPHGGEQRIRISKAVMHVHADAVTVFLDI